MNYCKVFVYSGLKCCGEEMVEVEFLQCIWRGVELASFWFLCNEPLGEPLLGVGKIMTRLQETVFSGKVCCRLFRHIFSTIKEKNHPFDFCFAENVVYLHTFYKIWYSIFC